MATKKSTKSRVSNSASKKSGFKFHWWMALILVIIVAAIGIAYIRFSHASGIRGVYYGFDGTYNKYSRVLYNGTETPIHRYSNAGAGCVNGAGGLHDVDDGSNWSYYNNAAKDRTHGNLTITMFQC